MLPIPAPLRAKFVAGNAPVAQPRRCWRTQRAFGAVAQALEVESKLSSLSSRAVLYFGKSALYIRTAALLVFFEAALFISATTYCIHSTMLAFARRHLIYASQ